MTRNELDLTADIIDVRDIIERIEELARDLTTYSAEGHAHPELVEEHATLCALMRELAGEGGDEQWEGEWYPLTLIRESHFTDYCQDLVIDCGGLPASIPDYLVIDWRATASNLQHDYTSIEIDGTTYYFR